MRAGHGRRPGDATSEGRRSVPRRTIVLSLLVLAGLSVLSATPTWLTTHASTALDPSVEVTVAGTTAAPGVSAAALVVLAAALSLGLVGRVARWASLTVVALGGLVVGGSALSFVVSPDAAARSGVAEVTGVARATASIDVSPAPYVTILLGAAVLAVAVWASVAPVAWEHRTSRYDAPRAGGAPGRASGPVARGERAVVGERTEAARAEAGAPGDRLDTAREGAASHEPLDERDAWDALTQGDDPT